jgi:hypothetical protein
MIPSQHQLRALPPEDRLTYKDWLRRFLFFYGAIALCLGAVLAANVMGASRTAADEAARSALVAARQ